MKGFWTSLTRNDNSFKSNSSKNSRTSKSKKDNNPNTTTVTIIDTTEEENRIPNTIELTATGKIIVTTTSDIHQTEEIFETSVTESLSNVSDTEKDFEPIGTSQTLQEEYNANSDSSKSSYDTIESSETNSPESTISLILHSSYPPETSNPTTDPMATAATISVSKPEKKQRYVFFSSLMNDSNPSLASTPSGTEGKKKKDRNFSSDMGSPNTKFKLFRVWGNNQDSEYKTIEKALTRFQTKDRPRVAVLKTMMVPWLKKNIIVNASDKALQHGRVVMLKWWNVLISNLPNAAYTDRSLYFECILSLMTRNEFEEFDRIFMLPSSGETYNGIPIEDINSYRSALIGTLHYSIDRLNQKGVYSNVISFCARVLALCFFKIPDVGFALLLALPVSKSHLKRMLKEIVGDLESSQDWITKQNARVQPMFPGHLSNLCFSNVRDWWCQFENAKKRPGEPPFEMSGNWIRRWQSDDSELFFSFYKHYHIVLNSHLELLSPPSKLSTLSISYVTAPGYLHLAAFFLNKIESLVHRNIHTITTVVQFEHPRIGGNPSIPTQVATANTISVIDPNTSAVAIGLGSFATGSMGMDANGNGKPKVLEMASRRFVETLVSIVEHGLYEDMCNIWIRAVVKKTNMYDVEGIFCLLDFLDTLISELDGRDITTPTAPAVNAPSSTSCSSTSSTSSSASLISIIDIPFCLSLIKLLLDKSDHTITLLRTISFIYTHFHLFTSKPSYLEILVRDLLLEEKMFESLFCHWSRNVRIYYMRLIVWRISRLGGSFGKSETKEKDVIDSRVAVGGNAEDNMIENILHTLQNRIESIRLCHEFLSTHGDLDDVENIIKTRLAENLDDSSTITVTPSTPLSTTDEEITSLQTTNESSNNETQETTQPSSSSLSLSSTLPTSSSPIPPPLKEDQEAPRKKKISVNKLIVLKSSLSSSGKELSSATCFFGWIFPNPSSKNINDYKLAPTSTSTPAKTATEITLSLPPRPTKRLAPIFFTRYAPHRHVYAGKAVQEYEAVNQEYVEWCARLVNIERGYGTSSTGVIASVLSEHGNGGDESIINIGNTNNAGLVSMMVRFPGLMVEYPKYFNAGIGNNPSTII